MSLIYNARANQPIIPPGEALDPLTGIDPTGLIKGLQGRAQFKQKAWDAMSTYEKPELPEMYKEGLPIDIMFLENQYQGAISSIESGIRAAGGNAMHYMKTDEGLANMRRATISQTQLSKLYLEQQAYQDTRESVKAKNFGQEVFLDERGRPMLDASGRSMTVNDVMNTYANNPAYSPFWNQGLEPGQKGERDWNMDLTSAEEARADIELYFNNIQKNEYGEDKMQVVDLGAATGTGLGKVMEVVSTAGYSNLANIKRVLEANGGLENNLSRSMNLGLARGFNEKIYDYAEAGYLDDEGNLNEDYYQDLHNYKYNEIQRIAKERLTSKHVERRKMTKIPGSGGSGDTEKGKTRWDAVLNRYGNVEGAHQPQNRTYVGTTGKDKMGRTNYQITSPNQLLKEYTVDGNPVQELFKEIKATNANTLGGAKKEDYLPHLRDLITPADPYLYIQDGNGVNNVLDISGNDRHGDQKLTMDDIIVQSVTGQVLEHLKPGRQTGSDGQIYGIQTLNDNGTINQMALGNWMPGHSDRENKTTNTLKMKVLIPEDKFINLPVYSNDNKSGRYQKLRVGVDPGEVGPVDFGWGDWHINDNPASEGYGGVSTHGEMITGNQEIDAITYNGKNYVSVYVDVPIGSQHSGIGMNETTQKEQQGRVQGALNQAQQLENFSAGSAFENLDQIYSE